MNKDIRSFVKDIVSSYSKYDDFIQQSTVKISDLPDFILEEFAGMMMRSNPMLCLEATNCDNPDYQENMLPSLLAYLADSTNKDIEIEFNRKWKTGIANYFENDLLEMIDEELISYNEDNYYQDKIEGARIWR